jgi:hypothetical protein
MTPIFKLAPPRRSAVFLDAGDDRYRFGLYGLDARPHKLETMARGPRHSTRLTHDFWALLALPGLALRCPLGNIEHIRAGRILERWKP